MAQKKKPSKFPILRFSFFAVLIGALILSVAIVRSQLPTTSNYAPGELIVKFKDGTSQAYIDTELKKYNAKKKEQLSGIHALVVNVSEQSMDKTILALSKNSKVAYVEKNHFYLVAEFPNSAPNDTYFAANQWGLENTGQTIAGQVGAPNADIDAQTAWSNTLGNAASGPVRVAVLDTGIDSTHPDLASKIILAKDFTGSPNSISDVFGHGVHVSGIIAAVTNNATGVAGVCPACHLMIGKVLSDNGSGKISVIANGVIWAADNQAQVINMSFGGNSKSAVLEDAINYAWNKGVVIVAAAGNSGNKARYYPAAYDKVIAVAATDNTDKKVKWSNFGTWVDVAAPGVDIFSTVTTYPIASKKNQPPYPLDYDFYSGTSMASPMVAGTAALIWSTTHGTSNSSVRARLEATADKISGTGELWVSGRINAGKAVSLP